MSKSGSDDGQRAQELLEKGAGLYEEGKLYEAISCWRRVLALDPDNEIAAEYLRFIEDNFQIGIDTFLEHHRDQPPPEPVPGAFEGDEDDDIAAAIDDSINAILDESIEELDWSELLEEGAEPVEPPPPSEIAEVDEAFFADLDPRSMSTDPGAEAEAWGVSLRSRAAFEGSTSSGGGMLADASVEMMPDGDPFTLPIERFAVEYAPGEQAASDLALEARGPALADPLAEPAEPGRVESGPPAERRHRDPASPKRRDLADMSEDSIDSLLDEDFRAWEQPRKESPPADSFELPFEHPTSNPPVAATSPDARPSQPSLDAKGAPVERRRTPSLEGAVNTLREHPLQRHTGPLDPVDPRTRAAAGVERVARTTPPTPVRVPPEATGDAPVRVSTSPPPLPPEALADSPGDRAEARARRLSDPPSDSAERRRAADSQERLRRLEGGSGPKASPTPPAARSGEFVASPPSRSGERLINPAAASGERLGSPASRSGERPGPASRSGERPGPASRSGERQASPASRSGERQAHPASRSGERSPAPEPALDPDTDLDDDLRALLTAGIAEIEAVERPAVRPRRLITAPPPGTDLDALMVDARRRQQADDFSGAIELVEQVLAADPEHGEARRYLEANTDRLLAMYRARLGSLGRVPRVKLRQQEIVWQSLDHREGFILSQVDGRTSFEEIVDISGMPQLEATRILARLVDHGVIG